MGRGGLWHLRGLRRLSNLVLEEHFYQEMKGGERTPRQRKQHNHVLEDQEMHAGRGGPRLARAYHGVSSRPLGETQMTADEQGCDVIVWELPARLDRDNWDKKANLQVPGLCPPFYFPAKPLALSKIIFSLPWAHMTEKARLQSTQVPKGRLISWVAPTPGEVGRWAGCSALPPRSQRS